MATSAGRFFAYSIGKGQVREVNEWFNTSFSIHALIALVLVAIGWPIGEFVVSNILTIPDSRIHSSVLVFRISLISAVISMISVPFAAMFAAKQVITEVAFWGIMQSILTFALAWLLQFTSGDRLTIYAIGMVTIVVFVQGVRIARGIYLFQECSISRSLWFDKKRTKSMFSFSAWNIFGLAGTVLRDQGSAILLNLFFGPRVNASYSIATQVSSQTNQLSAAMLGAFSPEITASEGRGQRARMLALSNTASKFGTMLVLLFAIPLLVEMDYVLKLWLATPPQYATEFCRLILITFLIDRLSSGAMLAINAHGKIAAYQITVGILLLCTLPIAWVFLKIGMNPTSIGFAFIITMLAASIGRMACVRKTLGMSAKEWLKDVIFACGMIAGGSLIFSFIPFYLMPESFLRLILVTLCSTAAYLIIAWTIALKPSERTKIASQVQKIRSRFVAQPTASTNPKESNNSPSGPE